MTPLSSARARLLLRSCAGRRGGGDERDVARGHRDVVPVPIRADVRRRERGRSLMPVADHRAVLPALQLLHLSDFSPGPSARMCSIPGSRRDGCGGRAALSPGASRP